MKLSNELKIRRILEMLIANIEKLQIESSWDTGNPTIYYLMRNVKLAKNLLDGGEVDDETQ